MKKVHAANREEWRRWLAENHDKEQKGIWLVFHKKESSGCALRYEESLEEALCFGWIDSIIKRIDDIKYCRKFTPRKDNSVWSTLNKRRVEKLIREGRMTEFGLTKIETAKRLGTWLVSRPALKMEIPQELTEALVQNKKAKDFFERLPPSCRKRFIGWLVTAKRSETRARRLQESLALLERGEKLGLR